MADGEPVIDVPAKLSARARVFSTGQGRKTDATDAHSVAVVALRTPGLLGEVTSRTRQRRPYARPNDPSTPFFNQFPAPCHSADP